MNRYPDHFSLNAKQTLRSLVPGLEQKCIFYSNEPHCILHNIAQCKEELLRKWYPKTWWEALFKHALMKYGLPPELTQDAMQVLNSAHVPWHAQWA